jgi:hypothetical protein
MLPDPTAPSLSGDPGLSGNKVVVLKRKAQKEKRRSPSLCVKQTKTLVLWGLVSTAVLGNGGLRIMTAGDRLH